MFKLISVIGTRPQFIKIALLSNKFKLSEQIKEIIINTNQHFDYQMSDIFLKELDITTPQYNLNINCLTHGLMTGKMMIELEKIFLSEKPHAVLVYGDCNTTLAGALVASKLHIPIIHIESGLRSFDKNMPEEINRILVDHMSNLLFCPTKIAVENLKKENIINNVYEIGDLMIELLRKNKINISNLEKKLILKYNLEKELYYLFTLHRESNTTLEKIKIIFNQLSKSKKIILFIIHPRTKKLCLENNIEFPECFQVIEPISYFEMMALVSMSYEVITDSGGLQKEAFEYGKVCHTLRNNTEWLETLGKNHLIDIDEKLWNNIDKYEANNNEYYYLDNVSENIYKIILEKLMNNFRKINE